MKVKPAPEIEQKAAIAKPDKEIKTAEEEKKPAEIEKKPDNEMKEAEKVAELNEEEKAEEKDKFEPMTDEKLEAILAKSEEVDPQDHPQGEQEDSADLFDPKGVSISTGRKITGWI